MPEVITNNLDLWTSALRTKSTAGRGSNGRLEAYGIKKLRGLILELAVRGKLVPQDLSDESASELLKRIAIEKAHLNLGSRIRGSSDVLLHEATDRNLPHGWVNVTASALFPTKSGNSKLIKGKQHAEPIDGLFPGYSASGQDVWLDGWEYEGNAIILSAVGARCGKAFLAEGKWSAVANTHIIWMMPNITLPEFAMLHLNNEAFWVRSGGAQPFVKVGETLDRPFLLPPLAEQHRIVTKVDELMALCDQLEQQQTHSIEAHQALVETLLGTLTRVGSQQEFSAAWARIANHFDTLFTTEDSIDQLKQTILQLAVMGKLVPQDKNEESASVLLGKISEQKVLLVDAGEIRKQKPLTNIDEEEKQFELPQGWKWCRLHEIVYLLGDGLHGTPEYTLNEKYYFVNGNNLNDGKIVIKSETKTVAHDQYKKYKKPLGENSLLVSINGTLGNVAFYNNEAVILGKSACFFNLAEGIYKRFIKLVIDAPSFADYSNKNATGSTIKNLGLSAMNSLPIALPPKEEQHRIVAKVDELMELCDTLKARLADAQAIQLHLADAIVERAVC